MNGQIPLGVDIGSSRVRIASLERCNGMLRLRAVSSRDVPEDASSHGDVARPELVAAVIEEMLEELGTAQRSCVCGIGAPAASLRAVNLPPMSSLERMQTARLEVERHLGRSIDDVVVRIHPERNRRGAYHVGAVARRALTSRVTAARRAGLKVVAVDHEAFALTRCFPSADAIVDVGLERTTLYSFTGQDYAMSWTATGGASITQTIQRELNLEVHAAERRKRIVGIAGSGESAVTNLVREIAALVEGAKSQGPRRGGLCLVGNGSRIAGIEERLSERLGVRVDRSAPSLELDERVPLDVARRAMADWGLAIGLAMWSRS